MIYLKFLLYFGLTTNASVFSLKDLIDKICKESDAATVFFAGNDNEEFVSDLVKSNFYIPMEIIRTTNIEDTHEFWLHTTSAILVVNDLAKTMQRITLLEKIIPRLQKRKFAIIYAENLEVLQKYFMYFKEEKFTRIFGLTKNNSYAYMPYADNPIQKLLHGEPLPNAMKNLNGFSFRNMFRYDVPRVFPIGDRSKIVGYIGQLYLCFLRYYNATFTTIPVSLDKNINYMVQVTNATLRGDIDLSMNAYEAINGIQLSYPILFQKWTIMVPWNGFINPNEYFLRPFHLEVWICIGLTFFSICVMDFLKDHLTGLPTDPWYCFSRTFLSMLNMSTERPYSHAYRFYLQVMIFAFVILNLYLIHLTSFLTVYIPIKQYETVQDLVDNNMRVRMLQNEWNTISAPGLHPVGFEKVVTVVDSAVYNNKKNPLRDNRFGYTMGSDKAEFHTALAKKSGTPMYHCMQEVLQEYYMGFLLVKHSPFTEIVNDFIILIKQTGLMTKWFREAMVQAVEAGLLDVKSTRYESAAPLTVQHLKFAWTCLLVGLTVAAVVAGSEKLVRVWQKK